MKEKGFRPMLCPNEEVDLDNIKYPMFASYKLDGIRCIFHPELGMVSRSLKPIQNKQLQERFKHILEWCIFQNEILDGELYAHNLSFQEITSYVMTKDMEDPKTIKKYGERNIPFTLMFYPFDTPHFSDTDKEFIEIFS